MLQVQGDLGHITDQQAAFAMLQVRGGFGYVLSEPEHLGEDPPVHLSPVGTAADCPHR